MPGLLLRTLRGENASERPVWLMRQAGRYLPEYRSLRADKGGFLALVYDTDAAAEITLQPIRRFGFDAAIIFSDILVVPQALGQELRFVEGEGPRLPPLEALPDFDPVAFRRALEPVYAAIAETRARLPRETALIGFAGAPWTLAGYMLDGEGHAFPRALAEMRQDSVFFGQLVDTLIDAIVEHLVAQVEAGAEAVQVFDSWAGLLVGEEADQVLRRAHLHQPRGRAPELLGAVAARVEPVGRRRRPAWCGSRRARRSAA